MGECGGDDTDWLWSGGDLGWPASGREVAAEREAPSDSPHASWRPGRKKKKKVAPPRQEFRFTLSFGISGNADMSKFNVIRGFQSPKAIMLTAASF